MKHLMVLDPKPHHVAPMLDLDPSHMTPRLGLWFHHMALKVKPPRLGLLEAMWLG
jgi:hypothetical protein